MDAVKGWAGHGLASDSEADRWLAWHRGATAEQIVEATGCSRKSAEYAVEREYAAKQFCCYFEQEGAWDFDDPQSSVSDAGLAIRNPQPRPDWGGMYDALNPSRSNPQLGFHGSTPTAPDRWSRLVDDLFDGDLEAGERFLASKRQMLPNVSRRLTGDKRVWHPASYRPTGDGSMTTEERSREEVLATRARVEGRCQDQVITLAQVRAMANRASARASEVVEGLRMITLRAQRLQRRAAA
jgi:hypothetical protein